LYHAYCLLLHIEINNNMFVSCLLLVSIMCKDQKDNLLTVRFASKILTNHTKNSNTYDLLNTDIIKWKKEYNTVRSNLN
jgi:hypothetical protein